jgi:hypothetical protein
MIHDTRAGQQFRQLPMFMSAREIRDQYQALDADRDEVIGETDEWTEDDDELFNRKYDEAENNVDHAAGDSRSLRDALLQDGVKNPISLQADQEQTGSHWKPEILGGHHRVAVMSEHKPDVLMPVEHFEDINDAQRSLGKRY